MMSNYEPMPLNTSPNLLINRRVFKINSAISKVREFSSHRMKFNACNMGQGFRSNEVVIIKDDIQKQNVRNKKSGNKENYFQSREDSHPLEIQSKSFKIRVNHRKPSSKKIDLDKIQRSQPTQREEKKVISESIEKTRTKYHQQLNTTIHDSSSLIKISERIVHLNPQTGQNYRKKWALMIPACLLINQDVKEKLCELYHLGINIYIKTNNEQQKEKVKRFGFFCHIVTTARNTVTENEIFFSLDKLNLGETKFFLMVDPLKDYPIWYPCSKKLRESIFIKTKNLKFLQDIEFNQEGKIYFKTKKEQLKTISSQDHLQEKIIFLQNNLTNKKRKDRKCSDESVEQRINLEQFQEKMIKYIRILQKQKQQECKNRNQAYKTSTKSSYQVINDLIRNNKQISKQISTYLNETQGMTSIQVNQNSLNFKVMHWLLQ